MNGLMGLAMLAGAMLGESTKVYHVYEDGYREPLSVIHATSMDAAWKHYLGLVAPGMDPKNATRKFFEQSGYRIVRVA